MAVLNEPGARCGGVDHAGADGGDQGAGREVVLAAFGGDRVDGGRMGDFEGRRVWQRCRTP
ncbi:hypothetical protein ABZ235_33530 [Streptomyces canus]|uniref:hypothetical protein n=1 Tax=Streptomyces canus TaxID=58343 RepID=UPI0033B00CB5